MTQEEEHHPGRGGGMAEQDLPVLVALNSLHPVKSHHDADEHLLIHWISPRGMSSSQTHCPTEFWD